MAVIIIKFVIRELLAPDGSLLKEGNILKRPLYGKFLRQIGQLGTDYFYNGSLTEEMAKELQDNYGSILTVQDFHDYESIERQAIKSEFNGYTLLSTPPPGSGAVIALILNILEGMLYFN